MLELDVTSAPSVAAAAAAVADSGHGLDVLVNNAGAGYASPIIEMDIEEAKRTYDTNVWGTIRATQAFAGLLIESSGRIVNVSTVGSVLNMPWICASSLASFTSRRHFLIHLPRLLTNICFSCASLSKLCTARPRLP